jgi:2,4-dienoyl-CoA reductase-like NADH-dependent reductase (Old Yellow Enzyme family)
VTDWIDGGVSVEDSVTYARELKKLGYDVIHCSSGGFDGAKVPVAPLYQAPLSEALRQGADIPTAAVGLITKPEEAEQLLAQGQADLIGLARQALDDPNWAHHAMRELHGGDVYAAWPQQSGYAVRIKEKALGRLN